MKKIAKNLTLSRETLRSLTGPQLDGLVGGTPIPRTSVCSVTCPIYCIKASAVCSLNNC